MAKIALGRISNPNFTKAMQELLGKPLLIKAAWQVKTLTNKFNDELKKFGELRKEILERNAKKKDDGTPDVDENNNYQFEGDSLVTVQKELNDLLAIEIEFTAISINDLGNIEIAPQSLFDLGEVIEA